MISSGGTLRMCWASPQRWPKGSVTCPLRSPQNVSPSGCNTSAPAPTARSQRASTSSTSRFKTVEVPPTLCGERTPISGNSSATITAESPNQSSTLMSFPPGTGMRLRSSAPRAAAYHSAARAASLTTMCGVMVCIPSGIAFTLGSPIVVLLHTSYGSLRLYHYTTGRQNGWLLPSRGYLRGFGAKTDIRTGFASYQGTGLLRRDTSQQSKDYSRISD